MSPYYAFLCVCVCVFSFTNAYLIRNVIIIECEKKFKVKQGTASSLFIGWWTTLWLLNVYGKSTERKEDLSNYLNYAVASICSCMTGYVSTNLVSLKLSEISIIIFILCWRNWGQKLDTVTPQFIERNQIQIDAN